MRRFINILLILSLVLIGAVGCSNDSAPASDDTPAAGQTDEPAGDTEEPSDDGSGGKVAIITNTLSQNEEEYRSAQEMVELYGDRIVHELWPDNFMTEQEQMVTIVSKIAADPEIKALVINQSVPGTNAAVDRLLETRDDMFIVYSNPQENPPDVASRADLILHSDDLKMGENIPVQAQKLGAKTLVHYSFPRHMSQVLLSARRELMREKSAEIGLEFIDATAPDPTGDQGVTGTQQFILEDVPKMVEQYGKDTAFFATNCAMQIPLIKAAVEEGAIYPQPCCPSPYHGYPTALGIESGDYSGDSLQNVISETTRILDEKGVLGRFSTWPVPMAMLSTVTGTEYAMKWIDGEVGEELDLDVLQEIMADYAGVAVETSAYAEEGTEYENYRLIIMDFLTYGEE